KLLNEGHGNGTHWIPAEVDVSIRKGWFYHAEEDTLVKTPQQLFDIYLTSVGRGSTLLLNVPPDRRGLVHEKDVASLQGFRKLLDSEFRTNLALNKKVTATSHRGDDKRYAANHITDGNKDTYWSTNDEVLTGSLEIELEKNQSIKYVVLQEDVRLGQRIKAFSVDVLHGDQWESVVRATTIGYKRILRLEHPVQAEAIRINILDAKACPVISNVAVY
ncbi:MAG TPA: discoidin domain-containing protein, partial [Cyclobacteriaceae bacterium]|nr:discoidin domain-containing protein [Cyclobacteriaceae bacterium]